MLKRKKTWSVALAAALMIANVTGAEARGTNNWAEIGTSRLLDFESLVSNDVSTMKGDWLAAQLSHQNEAAMHYDAEKGVFGKAADDTCLHIWNDPAESYTGSNMFQNLQLNDTTGSGESGALKVDAVGEGWDINFDIAYNGTASRKTIMGASWTGTERFGGSTAWENLFYINGDGTYGVMNSLTGQKINPNTWYNIGIKIYKTSDNSNNLVECYVDGKLVKNFSVALKEYWKVFQGFKYIQIGNGVPDNNATQSDLYVDNFKVTLLDGYSSTTTVKTMDLNEAENGRKGTWNGDFSVIMADSGNGKSASFKTEIVSGAMGRSAQDKSIHMYNDPNVATTAGDPWGYVQIQNNGNVSLPVAQGKYHTTSFSISASDITYINMTAFLSGATTGGWDKGRVNEYFTVKNGVVYFYGNSTGAGIVPDKFYKFDIVTYSGKNSDSADPNKVKVYMDNKLIYTNDKLTVTVKSNSASAETLESFAGIYDMWFGSYLFPQGTATGSYCPYRDFYLDDFSMSVSDTEPEFTEPGIDSQNESFKKYFDGTLVNYVDSDAKWDGSIIDAGNNAALIIKTADGKTVSTGEQIDKAWYYALSAGDDTVYGKLVNESTAPAVDEKFGDYADDYLSQFWFGIPERKCTTRSYEAGVAGRASDDYSFKISTQNYNVEELKNDAAYATQGDLYLLEQGMPYLNAMTVTQGSWAQGHYMSLDKYIPTHIEYSILLEGDGWYETNFTAMTEHPAVNSDKLVVFKQDGSIRDITGNVVGSFEKNQWIKVELSLYPAEFTAIVKINGKQVSSAPYFSNPDTDSNRLRSFKMIQAFSSAENVDINRSGAFYIDDFKAYQGSYQAGSCIDDIKLVSGSDDILVYDGGAVVINDDTNDIYGLDVSSDSNFRIYEDDTYDNELAEFDYITGGNVFVLSDGELYRYYMVLYDEDLAPAAVELKAVFDADGNDVLKDGVMPGENAALTADISVCKPNTRGVVIAVQYASDGKLLNCDMKSFSCNSGADGSEYMFAKNIKTTVNTDIDAEASTVKLMLWDGLDSIKPYITPEELSVQ